MKFPKMIIDALKNIEMSGYDDERKHFMNGIMNMWSDEEDHRTLNAVKDSLEQHTFYSYIVMGFLDNRDMEDITDKLFEEYVHIYCLAIIDEIEEDFNQPVPDDDEAKEERIEEYMKCQMEMMNLLKAKKITQAEGMKILKEKYPEFVPDDDDEEEKKEEVKVIRRRPKVALYLPLEKGTESLINLEIKIDG